MKNSSRRLNDFRNFAPQTVKTKIKKKIVYKNAANLHNKLLTINFNDYSYIANKKGRDG